MHILQDLRYAARGLRRTVPVRFRRRVRPRRLAASAVAVAVTVPTAMAAAAATAAAAVPLSAQAGDSAAGGPGEWRVGGSIGVPGYRRTPAPAAFTFGLHLTRVPAGPAGLDLAFAVAPYGLAHGALTAGGRAGITVPLHAGPLLVLPAAGGTLIGAMSSRGAGVLGVGYHVGAAAVSATGLRLGMTVHWLAGESYPFWLVELGFLRRPGW